jgi:carboxyl-terminal processing protease
MLKNKSSKVMFGLLLVSVFLFGFYSKDVVNLVKSNGLKNITSLSSVATVSAQDKSGAIGDMSLFWKVSGLLEEKQIKAQQIDSKDKLYGAIKGLAESYGDPYTTFFPPAEASSFKTAVSGAFEGVGMEVGLRDNVLTVISPLKGSPAEKAGMRPDDRIVQINANSTEGLSVEAAIKQIRGPKGTPVTLKVFRNTSQKMLDITIVREKIDLPIIDAKTNKDSFVISLYSFSENSPEKFENALNEFKKSGKKNLVLDLRNNPGGYLEAAVLMASFFIEKDKNIVSEDFTRTGKRNEHPSKGFGTFGDDVKIVVLVNKGSASASEILAGALQDYRKAKVVGEVSFGKGSVQEYIELEGGTSLKMTVAKWLTPLGKSISDHGVTPDVIVPYKEDVTKAKVKKDNQLDYAYFMFGNWSKYKGVSVLDSTGINTASSTKN